MFNWGSGTSMIFYMALLVLSFVVPLWVLFSSVCGSLATTYGRSRWRWVLVALGISPLLAIPLLMLMGKVSPRKQAFRSRRDL